MTDETLTPAEDGVPAQDKATTTWGWDCPLPHTDEQAYGGEGVTWQDAMDAKASHIAEHHTGGAHG